MIIDLPKRVDWADVVAKLSAMGVSNAELARRVKLRRSAITRLKNGSEPMFSNAVAILRVYVEVHQKQHQGA
jgi:predicted transcriptional regulator